MLHEPGSPLQRFSLDVLSCLRKQAAKLEQSLLADAHEENVGNEVDGRTLVLGIILGKGLEHQVRLQLAQDLVVPEVRVLWQVQNGLSTDLLVGLVVKHLDYSLPDEEHLLHVALVADDWPVWRENSTEHIDDQLVGEAALALIEEVVEGTLELLEDPRVLNEVGLHFGSDLLVEVELLNNQVEIVQESLLNVLPNVVVKGWLDVEWLV